MRWGDVEREAPDLARAARAFFDASKHKTIATLRRDGSPRSEARDRLVIESWHEGRGRSRVEGT